MIDKPLYGNPLGGGLALAGGGSLLQNPELDPNREKQFFYNKDLNKLFNMEMGQKFGAPKGFESINKDQYQNFADQGATEQGKDFFNDAMGGGYNLDLPRLTSGPNSGQLDRNSAEFLYYYGDQQNKLPPKLSLGEGISGISAIGGPPPLEGTVGVNPIVSGNEYEIASEQGVGQDIFGNNPAVTAVPSTPNPIQGMGFDQQPFQTTGQYLTGPNQDDILGTLKNIEQGIASLGQGGMNQSSFGGFDNNFGIGSFFPPYGGMYGQ